MPAAAVIPAVASVASAGIGALAGGSKQTTTQTQDQSRTPWGPQQPPLQNALNDATNVYNQRQQQGPYTGQLYAGLTGLQNDALGAANSWATKQGAGLATNDSNAASALTSQAGNYAGIAGRLANYNQPGPDGTLSGVIGNVATGQTGLNPQLSGALNAAAIGGAQTIGGYNSGLTGVMNSAAKDPTQQLTQDATSYMNSAPVQGAINNVNSQINQTLTEQTVPGLNRQAAMGGNLNSSRAGMAEAQANQGAALAMGNADSSILNNAYNTGLQTAANQRTVGLQAGLGAASAGINDNTTLANTAGNQQLNAANQQLTAANAGLTQNLNYQKQNVDTQLAGNQQLGQGLLYGNMLGNSAGGLAGQNVDLLAGAGGLQQKDNQGNLNQNYAQYQLKNDYGQGILNDYMKTATAPQGYYQQDGTQQTTPPTNQLSAIGGAANMVGAQFAPGGALSGLFNSPGSSYNPAAAGNAGGTAGGAGAGTLQSMGFYNPIS